jgi:hypothetical protein
MTQPADPLSLPSTDSPAPPDRKAVLKYLLFTLSLPERALRTSAGLVGGAAREATSLLIPQAFRNSTTYQTFIKQNLDYLTETVGGVRRQCAAPQEVELEDFVARKAVGNFIDLAGMLTLHMSPFAILAIVSDVAYGSNAYLRELGRELKQQGVIDDDSTILHVDDLLSALGKASGQSAKALNAPPLTVQGLKETVAQTREAVQGIDPTRLIPKAELKRMWDEMQEIARREGVSMLTVSTAMTMHTLGKLGSVGRGMLTGAKVAGTMLSRHVIDHYSTALATVREQGVYCTLAATCQPYVDAVWTNFALEKTTVTEDVVTGRLFTRVGWWICGWFTRKT